MLVSSIQYNDSGFIYPLETIIYRHQMLKQKKRRKEGGRDRREKGKSNLAVCGTQQTDQCGQASPDRISDKGKLKTH